MIETSPFLDVHPSLPTATTLQQIPGIKTKDINTSLPQKTAVKQE
jgi:hypothetical protein